METKVASAFAGEKEGVVACQNSQGVELQGTLLHFTRYLAAFEIYTSGIVLRMSEVLSDFNIVLNDRRVYAGRAVVSNLVNAGTVLVCEVTLDDCWIDIESVAPGQEKQLRAEFGQFLQRWQKTYKVLPEFKLAVADMESLFMGLRLWMDQVELAIRSSPNAQRLEMERDAAAELAEPVVPAIEALGDRFEEIASRLGPDLRPVHIHYTRRHLHPVVLCSPFSYRTFHKPLGYAGDYEMVNMIVRNPHEGSSLFAKVVNAWFLHQLPAQAHRNRIQILKDKLIQEAARLARLGRPAQVFNLGCGPAGEIQEFLKESDLCENTRFTLLDFNEETLDHTTRILRDISRQFGRRTPIQMQKKSVQQLLKEAARPGASSATGKYDFLYCAGLFDYLSDRVCKQLMGVFYQWVAPGGLLLVTNVDGTRPFRNKLEFILEWNLIYRNAQQMSALALGALASLPAPPPADACSVKADLTGVNLFLEIRKPESQSSPPSR